MAINRYDNYAPTNWNIKTFQLPIDMMAKTLATLQDKSDRNYGELQQLPDLLKVNALDPDKPKLAAIRQNFDSQIDNLVKSSNGDYSKITKDLYALKNQLRKEINPGGTLNAINSNYSSYAANAKELQDMYKKGTIKEEDYIKGLNYAKQRYQGIGNIDPVTGIYNQYQEMAIPSINENKLIEEAAKNIKPDSWEKAGITPLKDGRWFMKTSKGVEEITKEKAFSTILPQVLLDPDVQRYNRFREEVGLGSYLPNLTNMIAAKSSGLAYSKTKDNVDNLIYNRAFADDRDFGLKVAKFKYQIGRDQQQDAMKAPLQFTNISNTGSNGPEFSALNYFKNGISEAVEGDVQYDPMSGAPIQTYRTKSGWVDEKNEEVQKNPILAAAVKLTREEMRAKGIPVDDASKMKGLGTEWHSAIDANYEKLRNATNFNRYSYQLGENARSEILRNMLANPNALKLQPVDEKGRVNDVNGTGKPLTDILGDYTKANELIKDGRVQIGNKLDPFTTGVSGVEVMIDGKQYVIANAVNPNMVHFEKDFKELGKAAYNFGTPQKVKLPHLTGQEPLTMVSNLDPQSGKILMTFKNSKGQTIKFRDPSTNEDKPFTTLSDLSIFVEDFINRNDNYVKPTIPKPAKTEQTNPYSSWDD